MPPKTINPKDLNYTLLAEKSKIKVPTIKTPLGFSIEKISRDKDRLWTLSVNFFDFFTTFDTVYNLVIFRNPDTFNHSINSIIHKALNPQRTLGDLENGDEELQDLKRVDAVAEINKVIKSWNDSIDLLGVTNIRAELEKYERKARTKNIEFLISASSVNYFKDEHQPHESYVACLEIFGKPREDDPEKIDPILYHPDQFKMELLNEKEFIIS